VAFDPPNGLVVRRHDSEANAHANRRPRLPIYNAILYVYGVLCEELQLFWSNAFKRTLLPPAVSPMLREGSFDKRQSNMIGSAVMHKGRIGGPIDSGEGPGN
jgi:hypothetical protein